MDNNATRYRWAVLSTAQLASHWPPQVFRSWDITVLGFGLRRVRVLFSLPDQFQIKQGGPSFSQAGSMPVGADVILGCATRRAHLASADVADFLDSQDRLRDI